MRQCDFYAALFIPPRSITRKSYKSINFLQNGQRSYHISGVGWISMKKFSVRLVSFPHISHLGHKISKSENHKNQTFKSFLNIKQRPCFILRKQYASAAGIRSRANHNKTGAWAADGWQLLTVLAARRKLFMIHISAPCFDPVPSSVRLGPHTKVLLCILGVYLRTVGALFHALTCFQSTLAKHSIPYILDFSLVSLLTSRHGACLHRWAAKEQSISTGSLSVAQVRDRCSTLPSTSLTSQK